MLCLPVVVFQNILHVVGNALRRVQGLVGVDAPNFFVVDVVLCLYGLNIVHLELQHILVANGVDDGIGMERTRGLALLVGFSAEGLCRGSQIGELPGSGILGKDGRSREAEDVVFLECLGDGHMHVAELRAVALVEYHHHVAVGTLYLLFLL